MNIRLISHTLGKVISFEGVCMVLPLLCSILMGDGEYFTFAASAVICLAAGIPLSMVKPDENRLFSRDGFVTVALSWIALSIFGSFPFIISGTIPNFIDAFFETSSGFTTTGASVLSDVEAVPKSVLFWRSFTHWLGGMGVIVFLVALLPLSGGSNMYLMKAESTGPAVGKLVPKVRSTAKILYTIYFGVSVLLFVLLLLGGMSIFESFCTTFGTVGTGGFGIRNSSMAEYSSYIQIVVTVFMILCGVNFSIYYLIIKRKFALAVRSSEMWTYFGVIALSTIVISLNCLSQFDSYGESLKHSAFQVGSIITTTGFGTVDFDLWPQLSKTILLILMFVGASAGSTGGGIKVSRILILLKSIVKEIKIASHPKSTHKVTMDGRTVEHETIRSVNVFMVSYLAIFAISLLVISIDNLDFTTNFTAVAATINNIGPGFADVGPTRNFSCYSQLSTLVLSFDMLIGRLEIFPILVLLSPQAWKK